MTANGPSRTRSDDDRFCAMCEVDLGLHGTDDPDPDGFDCQIAQQKADLLASFERALLPGKAS